MNDDTTNRGEHIFNQAAGPPRDEPDHLLETYGHYLDGDDLSDAQQKELLMALWQIMRSFAELGFSVKSGDKLYAGADHSFDDVVRYITLETTAPETVASQNPRKKQEQP